MNQLRTPIVHRHSLFSGDTLEGLRAARQEAAVAARAGDASGVAALHVCEMVAAAVEASDAGRTDEARRMLDEAFAGTRDVRLLFLGFQFHFRLKEYDEAERLTRRRLELLGPETADAARAWGNLGLIEHFRGNNESAEWMMRTALEIDTRIGNEEGMARDLGNLGLIPEARGDLDGAERLFRESLVIAERIGADAIIASKLFNLGDIALARGRRDEARALWARAAPIFAATGAPKWEEECVKKIGELDASQRG